MKKIFLILMFLTTGICLQAATKVFSYTHPDGEKGWYHRGLNTENDGTVDMRHCYGVSFTVTQPKTGDLNLRVVLMRAFSKGNRSTPDSTQAIVKVSGPFPKNVIVPLEAFDYKQGQAYFLKFIKTIKVEAQKGTTITNIRPAVAHTFALSCDIKGKPLGKEGRANYQVTVKNVTDSKQNATVAVERRGWEGMDVSVSPSSLTLDPGQETIVDVTVSGNKDMISGMHEEQIINVVPMTLAGKTETIRLITVVPVASPFLIHTPQEWEEVKNNTKQYDWAAGELEKLIKRATAFNVPEIRRRGSDSGTDGIVRAYIESDLVATAEAYLLTGRRDFGEKVAETLRKVADPEEGYLRTNHLTLQGIPQEGGTMEGLLHAYDIIKNDDLLTDIEKKNMEAVFRRFCDNFIDMMGDGGVSNWTLYNHSPAAQCALLLHDMDLFYKLAYGPCGLIDHLKYGLLDDGWWYEMSLAYNLGTAYCYTMVAKPAYLFGIDWIHGSFPAAHTKNVGLRKFEYENLEGMAFGKFGPLQNPTVSIKKMWDGIVAFPDYRGVMFGMGDGHEHVVSGHQFEQAYYIFRDPAYASIIKRSPTRNLIWGVAELPENPVDMSTKSTFSPNAGIAVLRSQTKERDQAQQIQAAVKYGTHGAYHGHFDQLSLLSIMRYGRSFFNPETSWWGYGSYMYKWWVQPSMAHNMVVVDGLQKEPTECQQNLFYSGDMMQIVDMSATSRWSNPPYLGGYDQIEDIKNHKQPFVNIPANHPAVEDIGDYTDPVYQRRLTVLTDDYILLADYLEAEQPHTFDNLFQLRGVQSPKRARKTSHDTQYDTSLLSAGQFITSVDNYEYSEGTVINSVHHFAPTESNGMNKIYKNWESGGQNRLFNQPGDLYIDVYPVEPQSGMLRIGDYAECWENDRRFSWQIMADDKQVMTDTLHAWILGKSTVKVKLNHPRKLSVVTTLAEGSRRGLSALMADATIVTSSGKRIKLSSLPMSVENAVKLPASNADYKGGPIKIEGVEYHDAIGMEPEDTGKPSVLIFDLSGIDAAVLEGVVGCDYFVGEEDQLRRTVAFRQSGKSARFITVIEPHEGEKMIKSVKAKDTQTIEITLVDGRTQEIELRETFEKSDKPSVSIKEYVKGKLVRQEQP